MIELKPPTPTGVKAEAGTPNAEHPTPYIRISWDPLSSSKPTTSTAMYGSTNPSISLGNFDPMKKQPNSPTNNQLFGEYTLTNTYPVFPTGQDFIVVFTQFSIFRSNSLSGPWTQVNKTKYLFLIDDNLQPATTYYYQVYIEQTAEGKTFTSAPSTPSSTTTSCLSPTDVAADAYPPSAGQPKSAIMVTWRPAIGALRYEVYRSTSSTGPFNNLVGTFTPGSFPPNTTPFVNDSSVDWGTTYFYEVAACNCLQLKSALSKPAQTTTCCDAPTGVSVSGTAANREHSTEACVTWKPTVGAVDYFVFRADAVGGPYNNIGMHHDPNCGTFTDKNLALGRTYFYEVKAINNLRIASLPSTPVKATMPCLNPIVSVVKKWPRVVGLSWTTCEGANGYVIFRDVGNAFNTRNMYYEDKTVSPGQTYLYKVLTLNLAGSAWESSETQKLSVTTPLYMPALPPTSVVIQATSSNSVNLRWSEVPGAKNYKVYRSNSFSGPFTNLPVLTTSATTATDTSVSAGKTYYYVVVMVNDINQESAFSNPPTPATTLPLPPTNILIQRKSPTEVTLSWTNSTGATGYNIYRSASSQGPFAKTPSVANGYNDGNLIAGNTYYYKVSAKNASGESNLSTVLSITLPPPAPKVNVAAGKRAANGTILQWIITWQASNGATGYRVERSETNSNPWNDISGKLSASTLTKTDSSFPTNHEYYRVIAFNSGGDSPPGTYP